MILALTKCQRKFMTAPKVANVTLFSSALRKLGRSAASPKQAWIGAMFAAPRKTSLGQDPRLVGTPARVGVCWCWQSALAKQPRPR